MPAKKMTKKSKASANFEQIFKNIDDVLYKDAGADSELDYIGQTSWVLFLRYLDELDIKFFLFSCKQQKVHEKSSVPRKNNSL